MQSERDRRFRDLMAELEDAYREYLTHLQPSTTPLGTEPPPVRRIDWDAWHRAKERFDAADAAMLHFLRGGEG
jgi:hypothetical protein